jgi:nucleoside-diphosphate-sugar epimerase
MVCSCLVRLRPTAIKMYMATHQFSGVKVLVTGARGFIGSHLCGALRRMGAEVHAVFRGLHSGGELRWWQANLTDIHPEILFHLSGHVTAAPNLEFALSTFDSHVVSTVRLLTAATEIGCKRVVLTASLTEPQDSASKVVPSSPYAAAKWTSCAYGRMFHALYQTPVTIVRPFMAYGPMQNTQKIIPYVTLSLLRGETPKLASGRWQADWIYIDDVIEGVLAAACLPGVEGSTIDLGSGIMTPVREVVDQVVTLVGTSIKPSFGALPDRPAEEIRVADLAYAQDKLGWRPATSFEEGLARTVDWYREQRRLLHSFNQKEEPR